MAAASQPIAGFMTKSPAGWLRRQWHRPNAHIKYGTTFIFYISLVCIVLAAFVVIDNLSLFFTGEVIVLCTVGSSSNKHLLLTPTTVAGVKRSSASACASVCVCPHHNSITNNLKVFKIGIGNDLGISYKWYGFLVKRSKVKVAGSQNAKTHFRRSSGRHEFAPPSNAHRLVNSSLCHLSTSLSTAPFKQWQLSIMVSLR